MGSETPEVTVTTTLHHMPVDAAFVEIDGPWHHRYVAANGARFHIAELGEGPLVLLLHGFPQFWYAWRHQMVALADAGFRVAAMDLRGYGGVGQAAARLRHLHGDARRRVGHPLAG